MKYFTPELLLRFRSLDDEVADAADDEWEQAIRRYRRHFKKIRPHLPEAVRKFHDEYCLHDAAVFGPARLSVHTVPWGFQDVVIVAQNRNTLFPEHRNTLMFLQYAATEEPVVETPLPAEKFPQGQPHWLYDEIDVIEPGVYSHEILLSDGRVIQLRFRELRFHLAKVVAPVAREAQEIVTEKAVPA
jgi:hypothetical protein